MLGALPITRTSTTTRHHGKAYCGLRAIPVLMLPPLGGESPRRQSRLASRLSIYKLFRSRSRQRAGGHEAPAIPYQAILGQVPMGGLGIPPQLTTSTTILESAIFKTASPTHLSECSLATQHRTRVRFLRCSTARHPTRSEE